MLQPLVTTFSIAGSGFKTFKDIIKGYDDLFKMFKKTDKEQNKFWTNFKNRFSGIAKVFKAGTVKIGNGFKKLGDDANKFFFKKLKNGASETFKWIKRGVLALGAAISGATYSGIRTGIGLEKQRISLSTLLGGGLEAGDMLEYAINFANITPFDTTEVVEAVTRLTAFDLDPKDFLPAIGDFSAAMGKPLMQGIEAIIDA